MKNQKKVKSVLRTLYYLLSQVIDPLYALKGIRNYFWYFSDWRAYNRLSKNESPKWRDSYPQIHDRTSTTPLDSHYFYTNGWAMRRIIACAPKLHVDVGSQKLFANLLAAIVPVVFIDFRPLQVKIEGLHCEAGDILALRYEDNSINSLSSLHVIEHIGLGRYGDKLDPDGTYKAVRELVRVLAPGGNLFLSVPIGRERICFNAHRIHEAESIRNMVPELELVEFSGVSDNGEYFERVDLNKFKDSEYACGFFWFQKYNDFRA